MKKKRETERPIDFVILWVDDSDRVWRQEKEKYVPKSTDKKEDAVRFRDWNNLCYWFRGVEQYAPWVRRIHFVTWGHIPEWLEIDNPRLHVVRHEEFIPARYLPTFNSHTIELNLHRIDGLSEQFVYFNDDMFLNKPVKPEDFFQKGLPRDLAALDCIAFGKNSAGVYNANDLAVINDNFCKKESLRKHILKWFSLQSGFKCLYRTLALAPWEYFPGFFNQHISNNYLKTTFEEVWKKEEAKLHATCMCKVRQEDNVNQWVMKYWQLAKGDFYPRKKSMARYYAICERNMAALLDSIKNGNESLICLNDTLETDEFEIRKKQIADAFETRLHQKSCFEK